MSDAIEMTEIKPAEKMRTYQFPGGQLVNLVNVTHFVSRPSGTHRLRTADGKLHVIPTGWLHIEIDTDDWTL